MALRKAYTAGVPTVFHGMYRTEKVLGGAIPIVTADLVTGNQVALFTVPAGFVVTGMVIDTTQLDSSTGLTVSVGDAASNARFLSASTSFRAATAGIAPILGARGYKFAADTDLLMTFPAGATTAVAGTVTVYLFGYIDA